ncbi:hypothetical protein BaRGS_00016642 [Batillaria attramentaria]|uniref:Uncharacterized protein n=1 Tax=Batillaria attramentaria TaxID=370345 RepID=A0ABD0KYY5_9CAEN
MDTHVHYRLLTLTTNMDTHVHYRLLTLSTNMDTHAHCRLLTPSTNMDTHVHYRLLTLTTNMDTHVHYRLLTPSTNMDTHAHYRLRTLSTNKDTHVHYRLSTLSTNMNTQGRAYSFCSALFGHTHCERQISKKPADRKSSTACSAWMVRRGLSILLLLSQQCLLKDQSSVLARCHTTLFRWEMKQTNHRQTHEN